MKKIQIYSTALSVGCAVGVLMAVILTGNKTSLPRTAVVIPTKKPVIMQANRRTLVSKTALQRTTAPIGEGIDPIVTTSIRRNSATRRKSGIAEIISTQELNPFPGELETVTVRPGDTLFAIAKRSGINAHKLAKLNGIVAPFVIRPGQILRVETSN